MLATHDFVDREDLQAICTQVREEYLPQCELLVAVDDEDRAIGFMGMSGGEIESLFLAPAFRGKGLGRAFVEQAQGRSAELSVAVNAQNEKAVGFYKALGFSIYASLPVDDEGRPYPILRMRR